MNNQQKIELLGSIEYWDITLNDRSNLKVLADSYAIESNEIVFYFGIREDDFISNLEIFRAPIESFKDDWSHWNGDSYDMLQESLALFINKDEKASLDCGYNHGPGTLNIYAESPENSPRRAIVWCDYCWHNFEGEIPADFEWENSIELDLDDFPETPREFLRRFEASSDQ